MKKNIFLILFVTAVAYTQWQPDVRLTNDPAMSSNASISASGTIVHVAWEDNRDGNYEVYYKRSSNGGINWETDTRLTNSSGNSYYPNILVSGSFVHVVWTDNRDGNYEVYYKRSTDGGVSWEADTRLTNNSAGSDDATISISGSVVHLVWTDGRDGGNGEIYYKRSTDSGLSWGADIRLTNNTALSFYPDHTVTGQMVHVIWVDNRDGNLEIYYKRSTDGGVSWEADTRLTSNSSFSVTPSVSVSGSVVHVVWPDGRDGNSEIYYKRSTNGGLNWETDTRLTNNSAQSGSSSVSVSGQAVHVVWTDNRDGNSEIYYKCSTDGGVSWGADTRLTNDPNYSNSHLSSVSSSGSLVHVLWQDNRDGNHEIYYKRDPTGNVVGINNISSEIPKYFSLSQNYPNPFNPSTVIRCSLSVAGIVTLKIYDILGREVETLVNEELQPGTYEIEWDAVNYPSGVYYYKLIAGDYTETKKMVLMK